WQVHTARSTEAGPLQCPSRCASGPLCCRFPAVYVGAVRLPPKCAISGSISGSVGDTPSIANTNALKWLLVDKVCRTSPINQAGHSVLALEAPLVSPQPSDSVHRHQVSSRP